MTVTRSNPSSTRGTVIRRTMRSSTPAGTCRCRAAFLLRHSSKGVSKNTASIAQPHCLANRIQCRRSVRVNAVESTHVSSHLAASRARTKPRNWLKTNPLWFWLDSLPVSKMRSVSEDNEYFSFCSSQVDLPDPGNPASTQRRGLSAALLETMLRLCGLGIAYSPGEAIRGFTAFPAYARYSCFLGRNPTLCLNCSNASNTTGHIDACRQTEDMRLPSRSAWSAMAGNCLQGSGRDS